MTTAIRFLDHPPLNPRDSGSVHYDGSVDFDKLEIGDMCYLHYQGQPITDRNLLQKWNLTAFYWANNAGRPPLILAMPDAASPGRARYFLVDGQCYSDKCTRCGKSIYRSCECPQPPTPKGYYDGWTVSGTPPNITVSPSVNFDQDDPPTKHYHGFIQNGVIGNG